MKGTPVLTLLALVACAPTFSTGVGDFSTPIANSLGQICWVEVDASGAPTIRTATFRANATYHPGAFTITDRVKIQILGRQEAPDSDCTARDESEDVALSQPFELEREASQVIEVGGDSFGAELAHLVNQGTFWLGASAAGNVGVGEERVTFEDGRISVGF